MKYLSLVLINLTRNKRRTILTTLSITVSVFIFASLISLPGLLDQVLRDRANSLRLICHSKAGFSYMLPEAYRRQIESVPHVEAVAGYSVFMGTYRDPNQQIGILSRPGFGCVDRAQRGERRTRTHPYRFVFAIALTKWEPESL